jgi:multiple sugar transport system ATP-binding protein
VREALGSEVLVHFPIEERGPAFVARVHPETSAREGQPLHLVVNTRRLHFFDPGSGVAIHGGLDGHREAVGAGVASGIP